jgi:hypothetical protein
MRTEDEEILRQQPEYGQAAIRGNEDLSIGYERSGPFRREVQAVPSPGGLVAVIELDRKIGRVERVEDSWRYRATSSLISVDTFQGP